MTIQIIKDILLTVLLLSLAIVDIKTKRIPLILINILFISGILILLINPDKNLLSVFGGFIIGLTCMGISVITRGQIGMGDGIILSATGIFLGMYNNMLLLLYGLLLAAIYSLGLLTIKKVSKKKEIPFIPFLFLAHIGMVIL